LLGFRPLGHRRPEAKNLALEVGITEADFPAYPAALCVNLDLLTAISNVLANTTTFKITNVVFPTLSEIGAQSQIIIERPILVANDPTPAVRGELQPTCLIKEGESIFGSGVFFCPQLMKESVGADHRSWALFQNIPPEWIGNRNQRRNIPNHYMANVFTAISQRASAYRLNIIKQMVLFKRYPPPQYSQILKRSHIEYSIKA
jgi:hypothetical protein